MAILRKFQLGGVASPYGQQAQKNQGYGQQVGAINPPAFTQQAPGALQPMQGFGAQNALSGQVAGNLESINTTPELANVPTQGAGGFGVSPEAANAATGIMNAGVGLGAQALGNSAEEASVQALNAGEVAPGVQKVDEDALAKAARKSGVSTGMSTGAGLGGSIGAGIGSIVPVIGTGIGGAIGTALGTGIGALTGLFKGKKKGKEDVSNAKKEQTASAHAYQREQDLANAAMYRKHGGAIKQKFKFNIDPHKGK